jgi:copper transport protein
LTEPSDRSVVEKAPENFRLIFNEPVTPLVLKLIASGRKPILLKQYRVEGRSLIVQAPTPMDTGTHVFAWRVISKDGHPIGGAFVFSIKAPSAGPIAQADDVYDPQARVAIWISRLAIYLGLFIGVGGAFGCSWLAATGEPYRPPLYTVRASILLALIATALSIGLQGLDALGAPLTELGQGIAWKTSLDTSWGLTAIGAGIALIIGLCTLRIRQRQLALGVGVVGLVAVGLALSASGHASNASPQLLTRPAVFLHAVSIAFWTGSLLPLAAAIKEDGDQELTALTRFSHTIPFGVAAIISSGVVLAVVQVERVSALWSTAHGLVLLAKLFVVLLVLVLAGWNRFVLTGRIKRRETAARSQLVYAIFIEVLLVTIIFALAATWRFTPPPRAIAAAAMEPSILNIHTGSAVAELSFSPGRAGPVTVSMILMTGNFGPLDAKQVTLTIANPAAGVEPFRRAASKPGNGTWRIDRLTLPIPGIWFTRVEILMPDSTVLTLEDQVEIRP